MNTLTTVSEWNSRNIGLNVKFQAADGSLRKSGFVITNGTTAMFCKTKKIAHENFNKVLDNTDYSSCSFDAHYNS
jgi:hypothetical protein